MVSTSSTALTSLSALPIFERAPPRFDEMQDGYWAYERGRQWAVLAPITMDPHSAVAVRLFEAAERRGWIK